MQKRVWKPGVGHRAAAALIALFSTLVFQPRPPQASHLALPTAPPTRAGGGALLALSAVAGIAVALLTGFLLWFGIPGALCLLVGAVVLAGSLTAVRRANRTWRNRADRYFDEVVTAVHAAEPRFLVHWDGSGESSYQLAMWTPYLEQTGLPFVVIVRNPDSFADASVAVTDTPIVVAESHSDMERLLAPSVTTVFYVNNADRNNQVTRFEHLQHIQLGHGDSDKSTSSTRTFRLFDRVYVAGQAGLDRFAQSGAVIPSENFAVVGRPQVAGIEQAREAISATEHPTVLYAPTWRGDFADSSHSSLPYAPDLIAMLIERGCRVIFRPHPFTPRYPETAKAAAEINLELAAHSAATGTQHIFGRAATHDRSLRECFNDSDAMIGDVSAVLSDYLFSGKPLGAFIPTSSAGEQVESGWYLLTEDASSWPEQLTRLLSTDPLRENRIKLREHRLGNASVVPPDKLFIDTVRADVLRSGGIAEKRSTGS